MDAEGFVMVPTSEPQKKEEKETRDLKASQIQSPQSPVRTPTGSRKSAHWSPELVSESPAVDQIATISAPNGSNPYVTHAPPAESSSASFKGNPLHILFLTHFLFDDLSTELGVTIWIKAKWAGGCGASGCGVGGCGAGKVSNPSPAHYPRRVPLSKSTPAHYPLKLYPSPPQLERLVLSWEFYMLAYCTDSPLSYQNGSKTEWSYYKVVILLHQLKAINPSTSRANPSEKYIQVISVDSHEFWFMGFLNYDGAVTCLQEALQQHRLQSV
ncbi:GEM-like protein 1 [Hibiscus syriacus]|uniref:GEM-like protein 1 n=1 Tax=Hibiscus syriacus TaxID=106335 RepID=A0A6A3BIQ8_HIBSY|nr:GEM-like protein 1 [Hibiscus syriacus]